MRLARSIPTTLALALVTLALSAQAPTVPADTSLDPAVPVAAISQAVGAGHTDGMTWAAGPDYKAFFAAGTAEFIPALGKRAPHNFPVRFTTESIRRGGTSAFEAETTTRRSGPQVAGNTVWFDLGNGIVERYEARAEHLKQSFMFASPPAGDGDLVVRMRLDTELTAESGTDLGGLQLTSDYGGVEIGAVVGIDANGQHGSGTMHFDGTHLELVLADDFVRTAAYPLELDPTVGSLFPIGNLPSNDFDPEVAYGSIPDMYLVVWENTFSASDWDVRGVRVSGSGSVVGSVLPIAWLSSLHEAQPSVAFVHGRNRFFVAWQESVPGVQWNVSGRTVYSSGTLDARVGISLNPSVHETEPDVSGFRSGGAEVQVAFHATTFGIGVTEVTLLQAGGYSVSGVTWVTTDPNTKKPRISRTLGPYGTRCVVWETTSQQQIGARLIDQSNAFASAITNIAGVGGLKVRDPDVDGDGRNFLIVYEQAESPSSSRSDIYAIAVRDTSGTANLLQQGPRVAVESNGNDDEYDPVVCMVAAGNSSPSFLTHPRWLVGFTDWNGSSRHEPWVQHIVGNASSTQPPSWTTCGPQWRLHNAGVCTEPAIASTYVGGGFTDDALTCFATDLASINGRRFSTFGGGSITQIAPACGVGTASFDAPAALGNPDFGFRLTNATGGVGAFMMLDIGGNPLLTLCSPSCSVITNTYYEFLPVVNGGAFRQWDPDCDPALVGVTIGLQWGVLSTASGGCPSLLPGLHFSNAMRCTLDW